MYRILLERYKQKHRTVDYPNTVPTLPERFRGLPVIDDSRCSSGCAGCVGVCPTDAVKHGAGLSIDLGRCIFCGDCVAACRAGAISFTREHRLAATSRDRLVLTGGAGLGKAEALGAELVKLFGRSIKLRQVSAGGCNACEADTNVLGTLVFDLPRFGIDFVASPRHADGLFITGPVTENMRLALLKTYEAVPSPKIVIACGSCAIAGGPYIGHPEAHDGASRFLPVDLYIPGCPPHPLTILDGLLRLLGKVK